MDTIDQIYFDINVNMIEGRIRRFTEYLDEPEEEAYGGLYQAIIASRKANEADEVVAVKPHKHHVRCQNKYASNKAYKEKANRTKKYADARRRKAEKDNEMIYISTGFSAPWGQYTKETVIHNSKLWKPFRKYECVD